MCQSSDRLWQAYTLSDHEQSAADLHVCRRLWRQTGCPAAWTLKTVPRRWAAGGCRSWVAGSPGCGGSVWSCRSCRLPRPLKRNSRWQASLLPVALRDPAITCHSWHSTVLTDVQRYAHVRTLAVLRQWFHTSKMDCRLLSGPPKLWRPSLLRLWRCAAAGGLAGGRPECDEGEAWLTELA